jgi:hypothetical protein
MNGNAERFPSTDITVNSDPHALRMNGGSTDRGLAPFMFRACMEKRGYQFVTQKQCAALTPAKTSARQ